MKFIAKNLEDVAAQFDRMAENEERWAKAARTATDRRTSEISGRIWRTAAAQVRDTIIQP